jgi:hypothetical protein
MLGTVPTSMSCRRAAVAGLVLWGVGLACGPAGDGTPPAYDPNVKPPSSFPDHIRPGDRDAKWCAPEPRGCIARLEYGCGSKSTCRKDVPCDESLCKDGQKTTP